MRLDKGGLVVVFAITVFTFLTATAGTFKDYMSAGEQQFRGRVQDRDYEAAKTAALEARKLAETADETSRAKLLLARALIALENNEAARAEYDKVLADHEAPPPRKAEAHTGIAGMLVSEKQWSDARTELKKIFALDVPTNIKNNAQREWLRVWQSEGDAEGLKTAVESLPTGDKEAWSGRNFHALSQAGGILRSMRDFGGARHFYANAAAQPDATPVQIVGALRNVAQTYFDENNPVAAREQLNEALKFALADYMDKRQPGNYVAVLRDISRAYSEEENYSSAQAMLEKALVLENLTWRLKLAVLTDLVKVYEMGVNLEDATDALIRIMEIPETPDRAYREAIINLIDIQTAGRRTGDALMTARSAEVDEKLNATDRLRAGLIRMGLDESLDPGDYSVTLEELAERIILKDDETLGVEERVSAIHEAGKFFMRLRDYPVVNGMLELAEMLYQDPLRNEYICRFVEKSPSDVSSWVTSPFFRSPENRSTKFVPYNQAAARLLVYDVGQAEREVVDEPADGAGTELAMSADADGWHIFVKCHDPDVEKVVAGLLGGGQLEMFFRPGDRGAYYQWFISFPHTAEPRSVTWDSPHRHYRLMDDYARTHTAALDDGFGAYIFFPWEMLYDKLPRNGDRWPFSLQRWSRLGSTTWGGKVHEINRFGRVEWQGLTNDMEMTIKQSIVRRAWARYRSMKGAIVRHWQDEVMGDPEFHEQLLRPLVKKLDAFGTRVGDDMTDADVKQLFEEAVPDWMEFTYAVSELRQAWLVEKLFD